VSAKSHGTDAVIVNNIFEIRAIRKGKEVTELTVNKKMNLWSKLSSEQRRIWDYLEDDLSREVFMARIEYDNYRHTNFHRVMKTPKCFEILSDQTYIVYGYSWRAKHLDWFIHNFGNCIAVIDRDASVGKRHYNKSLVDIPCIPVPNSKISKFVLLCIDNPYISHEVVDFLISIGYSKEDILWYNEYDQQYLDEDIIVPRFGTTEVFADIGCLDYYTSLAFLRYCPNPSKILAFEPDEKNMLMVKQGYGFSTFNNVDFLPYALYSENTELCFFANNTSVSHITEDTSAARIQARTLDSVIGNNNLTFLKMDIEGAEAEALRGASGTIVRCKPKLAICVYHKPYEYVGISDFILSLVPEYKLFLRHYTTQPDETVLYAVI
jgi:FkbM family methyltransferase